MIFKGIWIKFLVDDNRNECYTMNKQLNILTIICWGAVAFSIFGLFKVYHLSKSKQTTQYDLAEWKSLEYGLLNEEIWNEQVSSFLVQEVSNFELTGPNKGVIKKGIESMLYHGVDHIDELIKFPKPDNQNILQQAFAALAKDITIDKRVLQEQVPFIAQDIVDYLDKPENQLALKDYLRQRIQSSVNLSNTKTLESNHGFKEKYNCPDRQACISIMEEAITSLQNGIWYWGLISIGLIAAVLLLHLFFGHSVGFVPLLGGSLVLLLGGVITPMIEIEASIETLSLKLMEQVITFQDQTLFFQSKSILEVVDLLIQNGDGLTLMVGFLILLFSILFPVSKLVSTSITLSKPQLLEQPFFRFLIYDSAKWSMADVFVVAIFMAFIGMQRIVASQLDSLNNNQEAINEISTSDGTALQIGFAYFLGFCLLNLIIGSLMKSKMKTS